jgi:hypothetical protein
MFIAVEWALSVKRRLTMGEEKNKREHSTKPEVDDLTDYQVVNSLGGAGVLVDPEEVPPPTNQDEDGMEAIKPALANDDPTPAVEQSDDYNDGADFNTVDAGGRTNT